MTIRFSSSLDRSSFAQRVTSILMLLAGSRLVDLVEHWAVQSTAHHYLHYIMRVALVALLAHPQVNPLIWIWVS